MSHRAEGQATLYEVTVKQGDWTDMYSQWFATDIKFPMQLTRKDGSWSVEYQHVKLRRMTDYLFQLPANFQPIETFGPSGTKKSPESSKSHTHAM